MTTDWQNRIVGYTVKRADQLTGNPRNPRRHPQKQRNAVKGSLDSLGWIAPVLENVRTGYLIDGHERVMQALGMGDDTQVPVIQIDLDEAEEAQALATFDFITYMAEYDRDNLDALLREVNSDNSDVEALLAEIATNNGITVLTDDQWSSAFDMLPDSDRAPFQQKTFTLHDDQAAIVDEAIKLAHSLGDYVDSPNENSNGNALARICEVFITQNGQR